MKISVIIPTLNEAATLAKCLPARSKDVEVIVVDGVSCDGTTEVAAAEGCKVCVSAPGRARQMNAGARIASGEIFLFLHADTRLPEDFALHVHGILSEPGIVTGAFLFRVDSPLRQMRIIERVANWRSHRLQMPFGDQAIFLRAYDFRAVGGFPDLPIMEDVELIRRLRKQGRIGIAPVPVVTSARRWVEKGLWKTTLLNQVLLAAYFLGVPPSRIRDWYYGGNGSRARREEQTHKAESVASSGWSPRHGS
ncbi:MAG: TIGR04283 family arsenosugar biosynthesis glycosyltransferase [Acidobacteria bacterium]|nr:TIGR04283 family arsenosugar biosynthesis glycosyltransferase [Acidobacteriota bacterium]